jgi:hypothetical protein
LSFSEIDDYVLVNSYDINEKKYKEYKCKKLILASGVLGTARIVLRSLDQNEKKLPLLCNPYSYISFIQPSMIGKGVEHKKLGFSQLSLFHDPDDTNFDVAMASIYSYQSLMLFRLLREVPLNFNDAKTILNYLMSGLLIMGIHHPDSITDQKFLTLAKSGSTLTGDILKAYYALSESESGKVARREKKYIQCMRSMGSFAMKRVRPENGSSIHYAGTLPFSKKEKAFRLLPDGRLGETKNIYVADGSGFAYLPAKGLTFSLMANAHIVATNVLKNE